MAIFGGLKSAFDSFKQGPTASILKVRQFDVVAMSEAMELEANGRKAGAADLPRTDSEAFDATEEMVVSEVTDQVKRYYQDYIQEAKTYAKRIAEVNSQSKTDQIRDEAKAAIAELEVKSRQASADLLTRRRSAQELEKELIRFREENRLKRPPKRHDANQALLVGILLAIVVGELVTNGYFLSKGSEMGYLGGVLEATIISLMNIVIAGIIGRIALPHILHRNWVKKIAAIIGFVALVGASLAFNLAVGHYRDAVGVDPIDGSAAALKLLLADPFGLPDIKSWALVVLGCFFSFLAAVDMFLWDDPYPGYGAVYRQWLDAAEEYNEMFADCTDDLREFFEATRLNLQGLLRLVEAQQSNLISIVASATAMKQTMADYEEHAEKSANRLLKIYRDANMMARKTEPPARFRSSELHKLPRHNLEVFQFGVVSNDEVKSGIAEATTIHGKWTDQVAEAYSAAQHSIDTIGAILIPAAKDMEAGDADGAK